MTLFTVLGPSGFIGSHLVAELRRKGVSCYSIGKNDGLPTSSLGHVIDCTGLTADFRTRPFDTVDAHVVHLMKMLRHGSFESYLYLSSTRLYGCRSTVAREDDAITVEPLKFDDIYNISKAMGESVCFSSSKHNIRVARLSNVYGYDAKSENFIFTLIRDAIRGRVVLNSTLDSSKDHINVKDVVRVLPLIAMRGRDRIYNVAYGQNTAVEQIVNRISAATSCEVVVSADAKKACLPIIRTDRIREEFAFTASSVLDDLPGLVEEYRRREVATQ